MIAAPSAKCKNLEKVFGSAMPREFSGKISSLSKRRWKPRVEFRLGSKIMTWQNRSKMGPEILLQTPGIFFLAITFVLFVRSVQILGSSLLIPTILRYQCVFTRIYFGIFMRFGSQSLWLKALGRNFAFLHRNQMLYVEKSVDNFCGFWLKWHRNISPR